MTTALSEPLLRRELQAILDQARQRLAAGPGPESLEALRRDVHTIKSLCAYLADPVHEASLHQWEEMVRRAPGALPVKPSLGHLLGLLDEHLCGTGLLARPLPVNMEVDSALTPEPLVLPTPTLPYAMARQVPGESLQDARVLRLILDPQDPMLAMRILLIRRKLDDHGCLLLMEAWNWTLASGWRPLDLNRLDEDPSILVTPAPVVLRAVVLDPAGEWVVLRGLSMDGVLEASESSFNGEIIPNDRWMAREPRPGVPVLESWVEQARYLAERNGILLYALVVWELPALGSWHLDNLAAVYQQALRNTLRHGAQDPDDREAAGKPRALTFLVQSFVESSSHMVRFVDDGRGMSPRLPDEAALEPDVLDVLRTDDQPGVLGGMGMGMPIIIHQVEKVLRGRIQVINRVNRGTVIKVQSPMGAEEAEVRFQGYAGRGFALPSSPVMGVESVLRRELQAVDHGWQATVMGALVPVIDPCDWLGAGLSSLETAWPRDRFYLVIVGKKTRPWGAVLSSDAGSPARVVVHPEEDSVWDEIRGLHVPFLRWEQLASLLGRPAGS